MSQLVSTKYRKGTATQVQFPTLPSLTTQPARIDLVQKRYQHDLLTLTFQSESTLWFDTIRTGIPITFEWRQDTLVKHWIGYVSHVERTNAPQRTNQMRIVCVGATFVLKERATRVFLNSTIPDAISTILSEFGFNVITDQHSQVFDQLVVTGQSYWQWITEQAKRIGYGVLVDGMTFVLRPMDKLIDMTYSSAPVMSLGNAAAPFNTQYLDRTLDKFTIIHGDNVELDVDRRSNKNVGGVDPSDASTHYSVASPDSTGYALRETVSNVLFDEFRTDRVVHTSTDAAATALAASNMARFSIPATINGQGDPRLRPFGTLYVSGTGATTDGFWMTTEVTHMFHKVGDYTTMVTAATDGIGDTIVETPFRTRNTDGSGTVNLNESLTNGAGASLMFGMDSVKLMDYAEYSSEANQGWLQTPSRWKSVG